MGADGMKRIATNTRNFLERLVWGDRLRERIAIGFLGGIYRSQFRRQWIYAQHEPHYFNHRWDAYELVYGKKKNPYVFSRGFFTVESLQKGDKLLDIGCGDGFFTNNFYAPVCSEIDAIDIEDSAIQLAKSTNKSNNINYTVLDATSEPFPSNNYDVISWDGAIGHFAATDTAELIEKISKNLNESGIFVGSESLGDHEGDDHLQYFLDEKSLALAFKPFFKHVLIKTMRYDLESGINRVEAFWRCSNELQKLESFEWKQF